MDYLFAVCEMLHISHGMRFLAVKLMDHFMDKHVVMHYHIKLVALTCLIVADIYVGFLYPRQKKNRVFQPLCTYCMCMSVYSLGVGYSLYSCSRSRAMMLFPCFPCSQV